MKRPVQPIKAVLLHSHFEILVPFHEAEPQYFMISTVKTFASYRI